MPHKDSQERKEYNRRYYVEHRERELERSRLYRESHRKQRREYNRRYYAEHREELREYKRAWRVANREQVQEYNWQRLKEQKQKIIDGYGGECSCCGETAFEFLTLDHVNNDGAEHRKRVLNNRDIYKEVIEKGFPDDYQLLCMNCNWSRGIYGYCPHDQARARLELDAWDAWHQGRDGDVVGDLEGLPLFEGVG